MESRRNIPVYSIQIRALATLITFTIVAFNAAVFTGLHLHVLPDGRVVVHSHPIDRNDESEDRHQHMDQEYAVLASLAKLLLTDDPGPVGDIPRFVPLVSPFESAGETVNSHFCTSQQDGRSPPSVTSTEM